MIHMLLSSLVVVPVTGFTVNLHFCQGRVYDVAMFAPANSCCAEGRHGSPSCPETLEKEPDHCNDSTIRVGSLDDLFFSPVSRNTPVNIFTGLFQPDRTNSQYPETYGGDRAAGIPRYRFPPTGKNDILSRIQSYMI
jgi:hypothetical protein